MLEVEVSVARYLRTPPYAARRKGLDFDLSHRLRGESDRSTIVIGNCTFRTDNGGTSPRQSNPLYTFVDPISTPAAPNEGMFGGVAGYRPRVRSAYYRRVYVHSSRGNTPDIGRRRAELKRRDCRRSRSVRSRFQSGKTLFSCGLRRRIPARSRARWQRRPKRNRPWHRRRAGSG